mmetsp:Transcript_53803/g.106980  ORF Transcript_53803/g.106980 Transcript_53803/m.106980 type:complete len:155 (-) Transcript_53803:118-582(-)
MPSHEDPPLKAPGAPQITIPAYHLSLVGAECIFGSGAIGQHLDSVIGNGPDALRNRDAIAPGLPSLPPCLPGSLACCLPASSPLSSANVMFVVLLSPRHLCSLRLRSPAALISLPCLPVTLPSIACPPAAASLGGDASRRIDRRLLHRASPFGP